MSRYRPFEYGLLLSAVATAASLAITFLWFRRIWYLGQLMSIFTAIYILAAWLIYTRKHPLRPRESTTASPSSPEAGDAAGERPTCTASDQKPGEGMLTPDQSLIRAFLRDPVPALLWSAAQLGALAMILYYVFQIGAHYH